MSGPGTAARGFVGARVAHAFLVLLLAASSQARSAAEDLEFHAPATAGNSATPEIMRDLASRLIPVYQDGDPDRYLANLSALQMVARDYTSANASRQSLRERRRGSDSGHPVGRAVIYDMYARARAMEAENAVPFAKAFQKTFRDVLPQFDDADAYAVTGWLDVSLRVFREALQQSFDQQRAKDRIGQSDALELVWKYLAYDAYRSFGPLIDSLDAEDDLRRYTFEEEVLIKSADGTRISAEVVRPRSPAKALPTLLEFTIYDSPNDAKESAAHGYAGVVAYSRGKRMQSGVVPYEHDGEDARAVIDWIAKQPWSDGRVGMYGEGYSGYTPWAAAKKPPIALKAIATSAPSAPGVDVPMEGSIFLNSAYRWSLCVTAGKASIGNDCFDDARWRELERLWYRSGRRYRDLGRIHGKANPIFLRWLNHPSYDQFWQNMLPYRRQFARINIPVLTTSGYYAASEPGALYYFTQHMHYNPHAEHTLLIGPYDDGGLQHGPAPLLHGYQTDAAALIDLRELRFQWFDHVFKAAAMPPLLKGRVNYQVMGANEWRHSESLADMASGTLRFYLDAPASDDVHRLIQRKTLHPRFFQQTLRFADRTDADWTPSTDLVGERPAVHEATLFESEPLRKPTQFNGLFSGRLDFQMNKVDLDLNITLYERLAGGQYVRLISPSYELRASYAQDRAHRQLIDADQRHELSFKSERMTSRLLQAGSRLVMVLGINKRADREINYGSGNDVSEESIADGEIPLKIRWYSDSYIDIPIRR